MTALDRLHQTKRTEQARVYRVDFASVKTLKYCRPTSCVVRGTSVSTDGNWRDLLARLTDMLIIEHHPKIDELYAKSLLGKSVRPYLLKEKPNGKSKRLCNGHWIYVEFNIATLVFMIYKLLFFVGIHESEIEITYTKVDSSPVAKEGDQIYLVTETNEYDYVPQRVLHALYSMYKNGFKFETTSVRLLSEAAKTVVNEQMQDALKKVMFKRSDDIYFLPRSIASEDTRAEMAFISESWLDEFGFFEISRLYEHFADDINPVCILGVEDFESFYLQTINRSGKCAGYFSTRLVRKTQSIDDSAKALIKAILNSARNSYGGVISEVNLNEDYPAFSIITLSRIISQICDDLVRTEINGLTCYQTLDSIGISDDFPSILCEALHELESHDIVPTQENLHTALTLRCKKNIRLEYGIPDDKTFRKLIVQNYKSKMPARAWKGGVFAEVKH